MHEPEQYEAVQFHNFMAVDKTTDYFSEISRSFMHSPRDQMSMQVILILMGVVALLCAIIAFMWWRARRASVYVPHGWLLTPQEIEAILVTARDQRSKVEIQFHSEETKRRSAYCSIYDVVNGAITLECAGLQNISRSWMGRIVDCYFRIQDEERKDRYYMFSSSISGIRPVGKDISHLSLDIPTKLELKQKRACLRVDPPEQYILGIAVWREKLLGDGNHDLNVKHWGPSVLSFIPGKRAQIRLENISAGGIKLHVKRDFAKQSGLEFNIGDHLFVLLDLWEPENGQRQRFWLLCRIQMPFIDFETRDVDLGLQFLKRAETVENSTTELRWMPSLRNNEVDEVGNWAMKRHLELYRDKGLE